MTDDTVGFGKEFIIDSFQAEQAMIGEKNFIMSCIQPVVHAIVDLRRNAGQPHGSYNIKIHFVVGKGD